MAPWPNVKAQNVILFRAQHHCDSLPTSSEMMDSAIFTQSSETRPLSHDYMNLLKKAPLVWAPHAVLFSPWWKAALLIISLRNNCQAMLRGRDCLKRCSKFKFSHLEKATRNCKIIKEKMSEAGWWNSQNCRPLQRQASSHHLNYGNANRHITQTSLLENVSKWIHFLWLLQYTKNSTHLETRDSELYIRKG